MEDKTIADVVKLQNECGFHAVGSGEYARYVVFHFIATRTPCLPHPNSFSSPRNMPFPTMRLYAKAANQFLMSSISH